MLAVASSGRIVWAECWMISCPHCCFGLTTAFAVDKDHMYFVECAGGFYHLHRQIHRCTFCRKYIKNFFFSETLMSCFIQCWVVCCHSYLSIDTWAVRVNIHCLRIWFARDFVELYKSEFRINMFPLMLSMKNRPTFLFLSHRNSFSGQIRKIHSWCTASRAKADVQHMYFGLSTKGKAQRLLASSWNTYTKQCVTPLTFV